MAGETGDRAEDSGRVVYYLSSILLFPSSAPVLGPLAAWAAAPRTLMFAIISDIHGNLEALTAVLADIERRGITTIYCLGDLVGYGPNPIECVEHALNWRLVILGNHDQAVTYRADGFSKPA